MTRCFVYRKKGRKPTSRTSHVLRPETSVRPSETGGGRGAHPLGGRDPRGAGDPHDARLGAARASERRCRERHGPVERTGE